MHFMALIVALQFFGMVALLVPAGARAVPPLGRSVGKWGMFSPVKKTEPMTQDEMISKARNNQLIAMAATAAINAVTSMVVNQHAETQGARPAPYSIVPNGAGLMNTGIDSGGFQQNFLQTAAFNPMTSLAANQQARNPPDHTRPYPINPNVVGPSSAGLQQNLLHPPTYQGGMVYKRNSIPTHWPGQLTRKPNTSSRGLQ